MSKVAGVTCWLPAWLRRRSSLRYLCRSCVRRSITASSIICLPGWVLMTALGGEQIRAGSGEWRCDCRRLWSFAREHGDSPSPRYRGLAWRGEVLIANARPEDRVLYYQSVGEFAGENYRDWLPGGQRSGRCPLRSMPMVIGNRS